MYRLKNTPTSYGRVARGLHWAMALVIVVLLIVGTAIGNFEFENRREIVGWHKSIGVLALMLACFRLCWRFTNVTPLLPADTPRPVKFAAHASHFLLYAALFAMPLSGWAMSSAGGYPVVFFNLFTLPPLVAPDKEFSHLMNSVHAWIGYPLMALIAVHAGAALWHHFVRKDTILLRMWRGAGDA